MALPPKGDPRRPLYLAIRSSRVLGWVFAVPLLLIAISMVSAARAGVPGWRLGIGMAPWMIPAVVYLTLPAFLRRRRRWAIVAGLVMAGLQTLYVASILTVALVFLPSAARAEPAAWLAIGIAVLALAAMLQLIWHLAKSFKAMEYEELELRRGFEPLPVTPVHPLSAEPPPSQS